MNTTKIEHMAISKVEELCLLIPNVNCNISKNDKEIATDGYIEIHNENISNEFSNETIQKRINIQVKGRSEKKYKILKKEYKLNKFPLSQIKYYEKNGGIILFVVLMYEDVEPQVFYKLLYPSTCSDLINKSNNQNTITLTCYNLNELNLSKKLQSQYLYEKIKEFNHHQNKQGFKLNTTSILNPKIESFNFEINNMLKSDEIVLYGEINNAPFIIKDVEKFELISKTKKTIKINKKIYYNYIEEPFINNICCNKKIWNLSPHIQLEFNENKNKTIILNINYKFDNFNNFSNFKIVINDLNFLLDLCRFREIEINNLKIKSQFNLSQNLNIAITEFNKIKNIIHMLNLEEKKVIYSKSNYNTLLVLYNSLNEDISKNKKDYCFTTKINDKFLNIVYFSKEKIYTNAFVSIHIDTTYNNKDIIYRIPSILYSLGTENPNILKDILLPDLELIKFLINNIDSIYYKEKEFLDILTQIIDKINIIYNLNNDNDFIEISNILINNINTLSTIKNNYIKLKEYQLKSIKSELNQNEINNIYNIEENTLDNVIKYNCNLILRNFDKCKYIYTKCNDCEKEIIDSKFSCFSISISGIKNSLI